MAINWPAMDNLRRRGIPDFIKDWYILSLPLHATTINKFLDPFS